jgi:putative component of membrane protein insertase Oxa1/YidC/SpoIIIJ protein YidD
LKILKLTKPLHHFIFSYATHSLAQGNASTQSQPFPQEASCLIQPYFKYIVRPAVRRAKFVLTCSEYSKQEIMAWAQVSSEKVKVVGCGVDSRFCREGDRYDPGFSYLLYVGNHRQDRGGIV